MPLGTTETQPVGAAAGGAEDIDLAAETAGTATRDDATMPSGATVANVNAHAAVDAAGVTAEAATPDAHTAQEATPKVVKTVIENDVVDKGAARKRKALQQVASKAGQRKLSLGS